MREQAIKRHVRETVVSLAKWAYGSTLFLAGLVVSIFLSAGIAAMQMTPTDAGAEAIMVQATKILVAISESTGAQADIMFSVVIGSFIVGGATVVVYSKTSELAGRL